MNFYRSNDIALTKAKKTNFFRLYYALIFRLVWWKIYKRNEKIIWNKYNQKTATVYPVTIKNNNTNPVKREKFYCEIDHDQLTDLVYLKFKNRVFRFPRLLLLAHRYPILDLNEEKKISSICFDAHHNVIKLMAELSILSLIYDKSYNHDEFNSNPSKNLLTDPKE